MATQVQIRRGTTAQHASFTGAAGELTVDTDKKAVVVHDGSTAGGVVMLRADQSNLPTSAPTTGLYNASGSVALATNGSGRLFVDSSGRVGVGTASPNSNCKLHSNGQIYINSDTEYLRFVNSADSTYQGKIANSGSNLQIVNIQNAALELHTNNTERLRITSAGLVGIGTTSPATKLQVDSGSSTLVDSQLVAGSNSLYSYCYSGAASGSLFYGLSNANTAGFQSFSTTATYGTYGAFPLVLGTNNTERARIDSSGRLLVGTSSSASAGDSQYAYLQVRANTAGSTAAGLISVQRGESATSITTGERIGSVLFADNAGNEFASLTCEADANAGSGDYPGRLVFSTTPDADNSPDKRMQIDSASNTIFYGTSEVETARFSGARNLLIGGTLNPTSATNSIGITNGTAPTASITDGVVLYAEDVSASSELKVRDEAGNVTTLSPHNFELIPEGPSEDMAWSYYSERDGKRINVDMLKAIRLLEQLTGEKLVFTA